MALRLFIFVLLTGWLLALVVNVDLLRDAARQRWNGLSEILFLVVGAFFSWPFTAPFGFWVVVLGGRDGQAAGQRSGARSLWPWWVTATTVLLLFVLIGLWALSVIFP